MKSILCSICEKGRLSNIFLMTQDLVTRENFNLLECDFCSVKQTNPIPDNLALYYDNDLGYSMRTGISKFHSFSKSILLRRELARITHKFEIKEFLDIGCGAGDFSEIIYKKGYKVSAADSALEKPLCIRNHNVEYYIIDYDNYEINGLKPMNKGLVVLRHVLEHIRNPSSFIQKMIEKGAYGFYIVVPNISSLKSKILRSYNALLDPPRHIWHFNKMALESFFEKLDLVVVDFGYDTIPTIIPSLYRFLRIRQVSESVYRWFSPKGTIATISLPFDWLLPNDVIWFLVRRK